MPMQTSGGLMKMRAAVLFLFVLALVVAAGCSTAWERSGVSGPQLVTDTSECRAAATDGRLELQETRSEEHTSELQSQSNLVCRLLLEKKKKNTIDVLTH